MRQNLGNRSKTQSLKRINHRSSDLFINRMWNCLLTICCFEFYYQRNCKEINSDKKGNKKENKEKKLTSVRDKDVVFVLEHINKSSQTITDENGLPLNYEYRIEILETKPLGKMKVISSNPNSDKGS